jgi:cation diffusion facilitator CzcD-associated flavoprotein CzcO
VTADSPADEAPYDLIVIGAGIGGVIALHYARRAGLRTRVLERQSVVGGLWAQLPAWQDIQVSRKDWTLGDLPIDGEDQRSIQRNIQAWVERFGLADGIRLGTPVTRASPTADGWTVHTPGGTLRARHLLAATGIHNVAFVPPVARAPGSIAECHASRLHDPGALAGRRVVVVGGGASAFDLLDLCLEHGATRIDWVFRSTRWMAPTRRPKRLAGNVRDLARQQMLGQSAAQIGEAVGRDLASRYDAFGVAEIRPAAPFDFDRDQLIPGRATMIARFGELTRHRGEIAAIDAQGVTLSDGRRLDADLVLWGTGYRVDVGFLDVPALAGITEADALARRCGDLFRALDAPNLYFLAPGVLETTGATPWAYAHACRTLVAHLRGAATLGCEPVPRKINHFELIGFLAARDPASFAAGDWPQAYARLAIDGAEEGPLPIP